MTTKIHKRASLEVERLEAEKGRLAKRLGAPSLEPGEDDAIIARLEEIAESLVKLSKSRLKRP